MQRLRTSSPARGLAWGLLAAALPARALAADAWPQVGPDGWAGRGAGGGIGLVGLIKADPARRDIPIVIVSYKDREEDRLRGLDAGANRYLTKSSFHDETFVDTIIDLIGEPLEQQP